ncbi:MAG: hypothetical protein KGH49_00670 [Candidatus Micrarchaeota archaeon]|nr:hypothetical protein [Candidatus Micrarchaeota archaeon]
MGRKPNKEEISKVYRLILELHNKVADSLNHMAIEKENLEDTIDALNRAIKMSGELGSILSDSGADEAIQKLKRFNLVQKQLSRALSEYSEQGKLLFSTAGEFAQSWNALEEELSVVLEKFGSKHSSSPPYIR